ncbi:MAG TPA: hypothetical protein VGL39_23105 [Jatrophihabitantaceae bacterium]|jgi:hypothetical protein
MFTETELREAMQHSATRADDLIAAEQPPSAQSQPSRPIDLYVPIDLVPAARGRRRPWLPVAAAVVVAAVAGGGLFLAAKPTHRSPAPPQKGVAAATAPASPNSAAVAALHTGVTITNLVTIAGTNDYTLKAGTETLNAPAGIGGTQVMALPAGGFDPAKQLTDRHPVTVNGTNGYVGKALIYLIDPNDPQQVSKAGRPRNTLAWRAGDGSWLILQNIMADGDGFVDVPVATLIQDAVQLKVQATPAPLRSGYRARWLPAGLTLTSASASVGNPGVALTLTAGNKSIDIELTSTGQPVVPIGGGSVASRQVPGGYWVSVFGTGYDKATAQRVLDGLDFSRLHGPQSGWWTFEQAVNG